MSQLIVPPELTLQTLPYGWKGQQRLAVTLMLATPIDQHRPYSTQDAWNGIMSVIPTAEIFDLGYPKPQAEVLVYGRYHAPGGYLITADKVTLQVGRVKKELAVTGERLWRNLLTPTTPEPISDLPLTYEQGFGGPESPYNPVGKGFPLTAGQPMPQLEYPSQLLTGKSQQPAPAGFNATSVDWLPRKKLWGTYDTAWQEQDAPFFARDLKPDFFMQAAKDQWFDHYIQGAEAIRLENMHPQKRLIEGHVPEYRFQLLVEQAGQTQLLTAQTDTLILLPDLNMQVLLARTELPIASLDGRELTALLAAYEDSNSPARTQSHYQAHLQLRRSDAITDEELLDYSPLRPKSVAEPLTPLTLLQEQKPEIRSPGAVSLAALAAAGGLAAKMAASAKGSQQAGTTPPKSSTESTAGSAAPAGIALSSAQTEQAANAVKVQLEAMGLTGQELNELMQAPPEAVPALINRILAKLFPDQPLADTDNLAQDPVIKQQTDRAAQMSAENAKAVPQSGDARVDNEIARALSAPGKTADFNILELLVEQQLSRVSEELGALYSAYPGDKSELEQPSNIGTKAILSLLKGISNQP